VKGATPGLLGFSTRANVQAEIERFEGMNSEVKAQLASADLTMLADNEEIYSYAIQSGRATFATFCSQCHGSGAAGAKGYPNLLDNDWLWGGDIEEIAYSIRHGVRNEDDFDARYSEMPAFGDDYLSDEEITDVVAYVRSLSSLENEMGDVTAGELGPRWPVRRDAGLGRRGRWPRRCRDQRCRGLCTPAGRRRVTSASTRVPGPHFPGKAPAPDPVRAFLRGRCHQ